MTPKPFAIPKALVWEAFQNVKDNGGAAGIDQQTIEQFEERLGDNLYKLWNRMCSGSYFPPRVKAVPIPKKTGGVRVLGVPTVADRVAQTVVKLWLEPKLDPLFHADSYGYRPGRSAHDAIAVTKRRCWEFDWVVEFDIKGLFDTASYYPLVHEVRSKSSGCRAIALIRSPFCFPRMTWTASSSPRLTHCHTVWRETPSAFIASRMGKKPSPASLLNRAMMSLVNRMRQGAPGVNCSPRMIPALSKRLGEGRPAGKLRFPWLYAGTTPLSQRWQLVSGRKPVQEERAADQDESQRPADAGQQERVAEGANSTEPPLGRLGCLLLPWRSRIGVSGR